MEELNNKNMEFNEINVKLQYSFNNIIMTDLMKLNKEESLENSYNTFQKTNKINIDKNKQKNCLFYLLRENEKILLDKKVKVKQLDLKEGDLIFVLIPDKAKEIEITHHTQNISSANLNEEKDSNSTHSGIKKMKTIYIILIILTSLLLLGFSIFLIYYFVFGSKKGKNNNKFIEHDQDEEEEEQEQTDLKEPENIQTKIYGIEQLITQKRPYYQNGTLLLYKSDKIMEIGLESELNKTNDELKKSKIKEYMDFGLIIKEENEEIDEENNIIKKWYA